MAARARLNACLSPWSWKDQLAPSSNELISKAS
jgi:hypothetical protein